MSLHTLSAIDGRYEKETAVLRAFFSEFAYLRDRTRLELEFLIALSKIGLCPHPNISIDSFSDEDAIKIQEYEKTTRHDVKAIEYYLRDQLPLEFHQWIHFGLTSEDINNIAQALGLCNSRDKVILPSLDNLLSSLIDFSKKYRALPMLAKTHGQAAVPTTLGKEIATYIARLKKCRDEISSHPFEAKLTGAVGNFNALQVTYPDIDWIEFSKSFIQSIGLEPNVITSQILPYDNWIRYFDKIKLTNSILIDFAQDMWRYISDGILKQKVVENEVGSSTMPQKVNPIDFENAEGNLGVANSLLTHYAQKLPVSRLQRDLSDSTVRRTFGTALGHTILAWNNISKGMTRVAADEEKIKSDLDSHWEVISEGAQTILRSVGKSDAYETLKAQTRGSQLSGGNYQAWVEGLDVDEKIKEKLKSLSPETYVGLAIQLTDEVISK